MITSYNANFVKICHATNSIVQFKIKILLSTLTTL
jgi:hypothetical protein